MKALGDREAKRKHAVFGNGGVQARDGGGQEGGGFPGTCGGRKQIGWSQFDGHFGIHEVVQTVRDNMTEVPN